MKFHVRFHRSAPAIFVALFAAMIVVPARADLESEIQAFEAADAVNPPPPGATLFVGSSTFNSWPNLSASFPGHSVLNRGFGGSQMSDVLFYFNRVVARYNPPHIVVYEGDNDLAAGKSVNQVFLDYSNFLARVELQLPATQIAFVSVKPSPSRAHLLTQMQQLNTRVRALAEARGHRYIDTYTPMLNTSGQPRSELFLSDMLHMNSAGYALWTTIIEPVLDDWAAPMGGTFLFDFGAGGAPVGHGPSPDDAVNYWNNIGDIGVSPTGQLLNLVTVQNVATTMGFAMVSRFNGVNEAGTTASTLYPINATRDSLYGNTELFGTLSNVFPSFKLTGLDAATTYSFTFYASRTGVGDNRETGYTVAGATTNVTALDAANNLDNTASVTGISPDAAGEITISLAPTANNNNNANHFTYLGVLRVDAVPPQTPLAFTLEPVNTRAFELQPASFSAAVSGPPPYFVQWFKDGAAIEGATQFTYTIASATLDLDGSLYSVTVSNLAFSVTSSNAVLRVVNDSVLPEVVSATPRGHTIELLFNEALEPATATSAFNYTVNEGEPGVLTAELRPDGRTVMLQLDAAVSGTFIVTINDVRDVSLNTIAINTTISGTVPGPEAQVFLIDFGGANTTANGVTPDDPINHWNNVTATLGGTADGVLANLITADNTVTEVSLMMLARFNGANENGTTAAPTGFFPVDATRDSLFGNTEIFNSLVNIFPRFKLTGLQPALGYNLTFYASRTGVGDNRTTRYTVEGAATATAELNAANNVTNVAQVLAVHPSEAGELTISLAPAASNNNGSHFTYLGVLRVQPAAVPLAFLAPVISGGQIHLQWTGGGALESAPTVLGPWNPVDGAPTSPVSLPLATEPQFFRLKK